MKPEVKNTSVDYVYIFFKMDARRIKSISVSSQKKQEDQIFGKVEQLLIYLEELKSSHDLGRLIRLLCKKFARVFVLEKVNTKYLNVQILNLFPCHVLISVAVFVSLKSLEVWEDHFNELQHLFAGWVDLDRMSTASFDPAIIKYTADEVSKLNYLYSQHVQPALSPSKETSQTSLMRAVFQSFKSPEKLVSYLKLPEVNYCMAVVDVGLVDVEDVEGRKMKRIGTIGLKGDGITWSCGVDLSNFRHRLKLDTADM